MDPNGFRRSFARTLRWRSLEHGGLEECAVRADADGIAVEGVVVGRHEAGRFGASYRISLGPDWTVRAFDVRRTDGATLAMHAEAPGVWRLDAGALAGDVGGTIDIDLSITPFTNTLPIRRAPPAIGATAGYRMLFVPIGTLAPCADGQRYTRNGPRSFRFDAEDESFTGTLDVDEDGLVIDYPPLFAREPD